MRPLNRERGAVAVEFALLLPVLVLLLVSILDFGLWYSDSIGLRSTAREGARMAVVANYPDCSRSTPAKSATCVATSQATLLGGTPVAKAYVKDPTTGAEGGSWQRGNELVVCTAIKATGMTGLGLVPSDGNLRSRVVMRLESDQSDAPSDPDLSRSVDSGTDPSKEGWAWC